MCLKQSPEEIYLFTHATRSNYRSLLRSGVRWEHLAMVKATSKRKFVNERYWTPMIALDQITCPDVELKTRSMLHGEEWWKTLHILEVHPSRKGWLRSDRVLCLNQLVTFGWELSHILLAQTKIFKRETVLLHHQNIFIYVSLFCDTLVTVEAYWPTCWFLRRSKK